ncbi:MAG: HAMP domain-containing protein [Acidobacteria bacterium]|nr:HAMP domain-containing protein [Acidobacteriota bacterium]
MVKASAQPLRRQLLVAILLLLAPIFAAAAWLGIEEYRETVDELTELTEGTARRTAAAVERELTGLDRMARNLSGHPAVQTLSPAASSLLGPQRLQRPSLVDLELIDRDGRVVASGGSPAQVVDARLQLAQEVLRTGGRVVTPLQTAPSGLAYVAVAYPVQAGDRGSPGVLVYYIDPQLLQDAFRESLLLPEGSLIALFEKNGRVLARNPDREHLVGRVIAFDLDNAPLPPSPRDSIDGVRRMFGQAMVAGGPWIVTVGIPTSVAFDRAVLLWARALPALGVVLGGWVLVAFVVSRRLTRSVAHLEAAAQRIGAGDFSLIDERPMATREFAGLQTAFNQMVRRFNETRAELDAQMAEERRMREEVQSLQRQVIRQERLAAVGQLVSGVAHEINNPLQAILGFSELLQMQTNLPESVKSDLVLIQKESARACAIIRNLAMFARQQAGEAAPLSLGDVIQSVAELRQRRLESESIELRIENAAAQYVLAVQAELQQVVLNFVVNAEQAIVLSGRQPGRITLRTRDEGGRVILEVEDTGPGVDAQHEARLFQPFFTTKPVGQGTGLGLSVSYGIIDSLGGRIGYRNAATGGAVFYFDLPAASE